MIVPDGNVSLLFPNAISKAFTFQGNYIEQNTLQFGVGYWLKFPAPEVIPISGAPCTTQCFTVQPGWNMIGSLEQEFADSFLVPDPRGILTSKFYEYVSDSGYIPVETIKPGKGYWVKANQIGNLTYDCMYGRWIKVSDQFIEIFTLNQL